MGRPPRRSPRTPRAVLAYCGSKPGGGRDRLSGPTPIAGQIGPNRFGQRNSLRSWLASEGCAEFGACIDRSRCVRGGEHTHTQRVCAVAAHTKLSAVGSRGVYSSSLYEYTKCGAADFRRAWGSTSAVPESALGAAHVHVYVLSVCCAVCGQYEVGVCI